jgi:tetratricopeptide (TPR) repeat protein
MKSGISDKGRVVGAKKQAGRREMGEPEAMEALIGEALPSNKAKAARLYRKAAVICEEKGDIPLSRRFLNAAATVIADEGWELRGQGDLPRARRKALQALEVYADHVDALNLIAIIHLENFEYDEAKGAYERAVEAAVRAQGGAVQIRAVRYWEDPATRPYMRARHGYAFCLAYLGRHKEALIQFNLLLKLDRHDHVGARFVLADLCHLAGERKKAEKLYKEHGAVDGSFTYALLLHHLGRDGEARLVLKRAFNKSPVARSMLTDYLYCFVLWETLDSYKWGTFPSLPLHRNALETALNANVGGLDDDETQRRAEAAYNFCNLCGPLWLKYEGSYGFLKEGRPVG